MILMRDSVDEASLRTALEDFGLPADPDTIASLMRQDWRKMALKAEKRLVKLYSSTLGADVNPRWAHSSLSICGDLRVRHYRQTRSSRYIDMATDRKFGPDPIENLCGYILNGTDGERYAAIDALGYLREDTALPTLLSLLEKCAQSLREKKTKLILSGTELYAYPTGAYICETLARFNSYDTHEHLVRMCNTPGDRWLRSAAIDATGLECDYHDEALLRRYLNFKSCPILRYGAVMSMHHAFGSRLKKYRDLALPMLADPSPTVISGAIMVLIDILDEDEAIAMIGPLRADRRYCRTSRMTISQIASMYLARYN